MAEMSGAKSRRPKKEGFRWPADKQRHGGKSKSGKVNLKKSAMNDSFETLGAGKVYFYRNFVLAQWRITSSSMNVPLFNGLHNE